MTVSPEMLAATEVECVSYERGYPEPAPSIWRIEVDGYCADFPTETAANNFANAVVTTLRSQLSGITDETSSGYVLVPSEPTDHMINEGSIPFHLGDKWASMLAAAPSRDVSAQAFIAAWRQKFPGAGFPALADVEDMLAASFVALAKKDGQS